jgi:serine/threonine protein kinase
MPSLSHNTSQLTKPLDDENSYLKHIYQYSCILNKFNLHYSAAEYYWQVGDLKSKLGWIINLSVIRPQVVELLDTVLPILISYNVPFKVVRDKSLADLLLAGNLGYDYLGKIVCIYPDTERQALTIAKHLLTVTISFKGPVILTAHHISGVIYANYGPFSISYLSTPEQITPKQPVAPRWPFSEIAPIHRKAIKLLNSTYYPTATIKSDAKGDVIKAIYFKSLFIIKTCVIKQGRQYMFLDNFGRDVQNRLEWQYKLCKQLGDQIALPRVFDIFSQDNSTYLAMEYIRGISFSKYLNRIYQDHAWKDLMPNEQAKIIDYLLAVISEINCVHRLGFIHRDITPENFLIDKQNKLWLIDIELMAEQNSTSAYPPFQLGTPGFMSPEQERAERPTPNEDIYAIGALMLTAFTNLSPTKFVQKSKGAIKINLTLFMGEQEVDTLISDCLSSDISKRPSLPKLKSALLLYRTKLLKECAAAPNHRVQSRTCANVFNVEQFIQSAITGLAISQMIDSNNRWISNMPKNENSIENEHLAITILQGWHTGVSGPMWLLGLATKAGFDVSDCRVVYQKSWEYIQSSYFPRHKKNKTLYTGGAGIALAITEGLSSGLIQQGECISDYLTECFSKDDPLFSLSNGIAGQGIALLQSATWLDQKYFLDLLNTYVCKIKDGQNRNGLWKLDAEENQLNLNSLNHGIPGIVMFLLGCYDKYPDPSVKFVLSSAINSLVQKFKKAHKFPLRQKQPNSNLQSIILMLVRAHDILRDDSYGSLAEEVLMTIPASIVSMNFSLDNGLAGLGEIYLEAYKVFSNQIWQERAEWLVHLFRCTAQIGCNGVYWVPNTTNTVTADLYSGNSGIIHFLMRYHMPDKITHPLVQTNKFKI